MPYAPSGRRRRRRRRRRRLLSVKHKNVDISG
jgi:hypothetical protein